MISRELTMLHRPWQLLPQTAAYVLKKKEEVKKLTEGEQHFSDSIFFMRQRANGACGSIAAVHAAVNASGQVEIGAGSVLSVLLEQTKETLIGERTKAFMSMPGIRECHDVCAGAGSRSRSQSGRRQSSSSERSSVAHHFVTFVCHDGSLYELDGQKPFPLERGPSSPAAACQD